MGETGENPDVPNIGYANRENAIEEIIKNLDLFGAKI